MRKKNVITMIGMIVMIIGVFVLFNGQLSAEEEVGRSIFPRIETPHPYTAASEGKALVWTTTIDQPGAAWIKIHFSRFRLNQGDYVDLVDMNGSLIEQIKGRDISRETHSKFNVKKDVDKSVNVFSGKDAARKDQSEFKAKNDGDKTFSFWGPAIDGDKVTIELFSTPNDNKGYGFIIDEIGVGSKSLYDGELGLNPNIDKKGNKVTPEGIDQNFQLSQMITPAQSNKKIGKILYKKDISWFTCKGELLDGSLNEFLLQESCINSPEVINTLEVRFYFYCLSDTPSYQNFLGEKFINNADFQFGLLVLKKNNNMLGFHKKNKKSTLISHLEELIHKLTSCTCAGDPADPATPGCCNCTCSL